MDTSLLLQPFHQKSRQKGDIRRTLPFANTLTSIHSEVNQNQMFSQYQEYFMQNLEAELFTFPPTPMSQGTNLCSVRTLTADGWLAQYARYRVLICGIRLKKQPPTLCWASGDLETRHRGRQHQLQAQEGAEWKTLQTSIRTDPRPFYYCPHPAGRGHAREQLCFRHLLQHPDC